jgi:hypothetical protein
MIAFGFVKRFDQIAVRFVEAEDQLGRRIGDVEIAFAST